jgi:3D (Asp-Asp-Asp) domain-containing protein
MSRRFPELQRPQALGSRVYIGHGPVRSDYVSKSHANYLLPPLPSLGNEPFSAPMSTYLKFAGLGALACLIVSCEMPTSQATRKTTTAYGNRISNVRTTAYTHTEGGGRRNAIGKSLSGQNQMSAAADWSRFPLGTRFQIVGTQDRYIIDDYGGALVGTNTIDLYKTSHSAMRLWGVRRVDIDVLEWGSKQQSLKVLAPRRKNGLVRRMIAGIEANKG